MNEIELFDFINNISLLKDYFLNCIQNMPAPYKTIDVGYRREYLIVDVLDYNSTRLPFDKPIFKSDAFKGKTLSFDADSMNAPFGKLWLNAPEGELDLVMAVNDLTLQNGVWYYFPPVNPFVVGQDVAHATEINQVFVENVIRASFTPEEF